MNVQGITWHAVQLDADAYAPMQAMARDLMCLSPIYEAPNYSQYQLPNGDYYELYGPGTAPPYGFGPADVVFGFRVSDLAETIEELKAAGMELLGGVVHLSGGYSYQHFRGPDGRVYGLNAIQPPSPPPSASK